MSKVLVKYSGYHGSYGKVDGLFITDEEILKSNYGKTVNFGDILGKHSDVVLKLTTENTTIISRDLNGINALEAVFEDEVLSGYNPLDYIEDGEEQE